MRNILKGLFVFVIINLFVVRPAVSYADTHDHRGDSNNHTSGQTHDSGHGHDSGHEHDRSHHEHTYIGLDFSLWPDSYYYNPSYYPSDDTVLVSPPIYQPVDVNGITYYLNNGTYYVYNGFGYQAVAPPVTVVQQPVTVVQPPISAPDVESSDSFTINIPNDKGSYTAVIIKRSGNGYTGPQGEFYPEFPKVSQLKVMYGK